MMRVGDVVGAFVGLLVGDVGGGVVGLISWGRWWNAYLVVHVGCVWLVMLWCWVDKSVVVVYCIVWMLSLLVLCVCCVFSFSFSRVVSLYLS